MPLCEEIYKVIILRVCVQMGGGILDQEKLLYNMITRQWIVSGLTYEEAAEMFYLSV